MGNQFRYGVSPDTFDGIGRRDVTSLDLALPGVRPGDVILFHAAAEEGERAPFDPNRRHTALVVLSEVEDTATPGRLHVSWQRFVVAVGRSARW